MKQVFGDVTEHATHDINSVSIIETAAEKWVALTCRVANTSLMYELGIAHTVGKDQKLINYSLMNFIIHIFLLRTLPEIKTDTIYRL